MTHIISLTQSGFNRFNVSEGMITVYLSGKPLSGSLNTWPKNMGGGQYQNWFRGNCAGARPYQFKTIEHSLEIAAKVGNVGNSLKLFINGNKWFAKGVLGSELEYFKPIGQLM